MYTCIYKLKFDVRRIETIKKKLTIKTEENTSLVEKNNDLSKEISELLKMKTKIEQENKNLKNNLNKKFDINEVISISDLNKQLLESESEIRKLKRVKNI